MNATTQQTPIRLTRHSPAYCRVTFDNPPPIASFDKWAIAKTKRLANASLPPDVEIAAGWDACMNSVARPATQDRLERNSCD